jgi:hypothetical protein
MPKPFKLIDKYFSKKDNEWQWTYELKITFNYQLIMAITITDYYQTRLGGEWITNELILEIIESRFHNKKSEPIDYPGVKESIQARNYFKDGTNNHLWIRNIHPID